METAIGIFVIFFFVFVTVAAARAMVYLHRQGLLKGLLRGRWLTGALTLFFILQFIVVGIAMVAGAAWATPVMRYTIILWLVYCWVYGMGKAFRLWSVLQNEELRSFGDFMGRDAYLDELMMKAINISLQEGYTPSDTTASEPINLATNTRSVDVFNDEDYFKTALPIAIRRKIKRGMLGLLVQTAFFLLILWGMG
ncbi:MAG: hypothetical protein AAF798_00450 [Bacteroidota bacterium]